MIAEAPVAERVWEDLEAEAAAGPAPLRVVFACDGWEPAAAAGRFLALLPLPPGSAVETVTVLESHGRRVPKTLEAAELVWGYRIVEQAQAGLSWGGVQLSHATRRGAPL